MGLWCPCTLPALKGGALMLNAVGVACLIEVARCVPGDRQTASVTCAGESGSGFEEAQLTQVGAGLAEPVARDFSGP
jgi:hypothetical protein